MFESGWCPYCQGTTNQETKLVTREGKTAYETVCCKCNRLLRWHLASVEMNEKEEKKE